MNESNRSRLSDVGTHVVDSIENMSKQKSIEEIVEEVARCRYTGDRKTSHSEESYKTTLTIVLARILKSERDRAEGATIRKFTPWIEHRIECHLSFEEDAVCDCGLTKALTNPQDKQ